MTGLRDTRHRRWAFSIRVRRARWNWLVRRFHPKDVYAHLPTEDNSRMLRVYNVLQPEGAKLWEALTLQGEPLDLVFANGSRYAARLTEEGRLVFLKEHDLDPFPDFIDQDARHKLWQTWQLLEPDERPIPF